MYDIEQSNMMPELGQSCDLAKLSVFVSEKAHL